MFVLMMRIMVSMTTRAAMLLVVMILMPIFTATGTFMVGIAVIV